MANRRFIDFPIATTVGDSDIILIWQSGVNKQTTKATFLSGLPENLDELNDVAISGLTNGQILRYDSVTGKWENTDQGNLDLNDLNDVSIVSPSNGQVLVYNSSTSKWENSSGGFVPYTGAVTTVNLGAQTIQAGQFVKAGGTSSQFLKADGSIDSTAYGTGSVTSVGLTMPSAFNVANSPVTTAGTLAVTGAGTVAQYIRGDGSLADFPEASGGGSSISYYLNGSVNQGTIGGVAYKELNKVPILGAGTDFTINADGYIVSFITDAGDPNLLEIPGGNWNFETYFSASSGGGSPTFYVELYKVNSGGTATLIASNSSAPELIAFGTNITAYFSSLAVPTTTLALTDRLAVRYYVTHSGRTITMHTENNHLCQIITTFTTGLTALNGLTAQVQNFATGTTGTDFNIASATATHTFNLPTASATNRGALSSSDWTTFNNKENAITAGTTAQYFRGDKTFQTLNTSIVPEGTNLYYTEARVNANANVAANTAARHNAVTLGTANGLSLSTQVLSLGLASAGVTGALSGTDWSTFNSKQNALTNPVTGTGTTNYLPKFTGSTTIGNSLVFDNGTNVGIGTALPNAKLDVVSTIRATNNDTSGFASANLQMFTYNGSSVTYGGGMFQTNSTFSYQQIAANQTNIYGFQAGGLRLAVGNASIIFASGNSDVDFSTPRLTITSGGNLLVGTTTDIGQRLQVSGGYITQVDGGVRTFLGYDGSGSLVGTTTNHYFRFITNDTERMRITSAGNVGIGTASPSEKLDVVNGGLGVGNGTIKTGITYSSLGLVGTFTNHDLGIITNGSERMRITSGGNLLVGTTTDAGFRLDVNGTAKATKLVSASNAFAGTLDFGTGSFKGIMDYTAASGLWSLNNQTAGSGTTAYFQFQADSSPIVTMLKNGNVGIGTSSPTNGLLVINSTASNGVRFALESSGTINGIVALGSNAISGLSTSDLALWTRGIMAFETGASGEKMRLTSGGNLLVGTTTDNGARLQVSGQGFFTHPDTPVRLNNSGGTFTQLDFLNNGTQKGAIWWNNSSNTLNLWTGVTTMTLTSSGNVGIGTSSPSAVLEVQGGNGNQLDLDNTGQQFTQLNFRHNGTQRSAIWIDNTNSLFEHYVVSGYGQTFYTNATERMRITSGGNVLIGTTTDSGSKLNVNGTIRSNDTNGLGLGSIAGYRRVQYGSDNATSFTLLTDGNAYAGLYALSANFSSTIKTGNPTGSTSDNWLLGRALVSGSSTPDRWIRVQIGNLYYDILAVYMGSV